MSETIRVLIDARMLLGRFSGVARFVTALVEELVKFDGLRVVALCGDEPYAPWKGRSQIQMLVTDFTRSHRAAARRLIWEEARLPYWIRKADADVWHATWNSGIPARCRVPGVLTIHDLILWGAPPGSPRAWVDRLAYRAGVRSSARRAQVITTVSEFTRSRVLTVLRTRAHRVHVVANGVDLRTAHGAALVPHVSAGSRPYVLYVGGFEPRKNVAGIFRAVSAYRAQYGEALVLRLTGSRDALIAQDAATLARLGGDVPVVFLGKLSDAELAAEYAGAAALLLLSRDEGFGLPALEAMSCGCPVIAARRGALPEVVNDAGLLVEPDEPEVIAAAIRSVQEPRLRDALVSRGLRRAGGYTWARAAERLAGIYSAAASGGKYVGDPYAIESAAIQVG